MTEPTDAEIIALADETRTAEGGASGYILPISFARAVLGQWGPARTSRVCAGRWSRRRRWSMPRKRRTCRSATCNRNPACHRSSAAARGGNLCAEQCNILVEDLSEWESVCRS